MKHIDHKDLTFSGGILSGEASQHFRGTHVPSKIHVKGKKYHVTFHHHKSHKDREGDVSHWEYHNDHKDPRVRAVRLHIHND